MNASSMRAPILFSAAIFAAVSFARGQSIRVGSNFRYAGNLDASSPRTWISLWGGALRSGTVTTATFGWSTAPCPAAVRIKFFHTQPGSGILDFVAERGPFDVTAPVHGTGEIPPVTQTVTLDPPVALQPGDVIAISNLTSCGGPTRGFIDAPMPLLPPASRVYPGDVRTSVSILTGMGEGWLFATASDLPSLSLLKSRFDVTLTATDPRTGAAAVGFPTVLGDGAGYFSIPALTGDATFPEIVVKMVDATAAPPPFGGAFWFFRSSLTDVVYTLTVTDTRTGRSRTYTSAGSPAFCGSADTNAFPP